MDEYKDLALWILAIKAALDVIVKATPTQKDDFIVDVVLGSLFKRWRK